MLKTLPLFKSHYSLGKSILTLEKPWDKKSTKERPKYSNSIFDLLIDNGLDTLTLVEDTVSGLLQASKFTKENKIKLVFGLRLRLTEDCLNQDEASLNKRAKYIIFAKNSKAYESILKISSFASNKGFYYTPTIDFKTLRQMWNKDLILSVPFYDSFLYMNTFCSHKHVPAMDFCEPTFFTEENDLPFDDLLKNKVEEYCKANKYQTLATQSIFYKSQEDFIAYLAFRCIHNRGTSQKSTLDKPELQHMGSDQFNFDKWKIQNS